MRGAFEGRVPRFGRGRRLERSCGGAADCNPEKNPASLGGTAVRPGGSAQASAALERRPPVRAAPLRWGQPTLSCGGRGGVGAAGGSRPWRQAGATAVRDAGSREVLRGLFFLQADIRYALPRLLLLQGREDEKREGIREYGFAV